MAGSNGQGEQDGARRIPIRGGLLMRALGVLSDRANFASAFGKSFWNTTDGAYKRDIFTALGYDETLTVRHYRDRYHRGGIAERLVEALPRGTWGSGVEVREDPDPDVDTEFEEAVKALDERLELFPRLFRADILAGLGSYSVLYLGAPGDPATPLPANLRSGKDLLYVLTLAEDRATIESFVEGPDRIDDERYGLPEFYELTIGSSAVTTSAGSSAKNPTSASKTIRAHWSRVIHIAERTLEDDIYGVPRLRAVWNYLDDLTKIVGGGAEATWALINPGMQVDIDPTIEMTTAEEEAIEDQITEFLHDQRRVLQTRGARVNRFTSSVASFGPNADKVIDLIAGTTGIPKRILLGSERGELGSSQDRDNWADRVMERRREFAVPLVRRILDRLIEHKALPTPTEYEVIWPERVATLDEKADALGKIAAANNAQSTAEGKVIVTADEIRDRILNMDPLEEVEPELEVEPIEEEPELEPEPPEGNPPPPPPPPPGGGEPEEEEPEAPATARALASKNASYRAIHRAADSNVGRFEAQYVAAWLEGARRVDLSALEDAISGGDNAGLDRAVSRALDTVEREVSDATEALLLSTLNDAGRAAVAVARRRGGLVRASSARNAAGFDFAFDEANPRSIRWAKQRAALLIQETTAGIAVRADVLRALREMIAGGIRDGVPPRALARSIREVVGLRSDQVRAVSNLAAELRNAKPGALITRFGPQPTLRKTAGFKVRIPAGGADQAFIDKQLARYSRMQLNLRARTIARTETLRAANEGQRELWRQARTEGLLPMNARRVWIDSGDAAVRESHAQHNGEVTGIDEEWPWGYEPGDEPNCRCGQDIASDEDLAAKGIDPAAPLEGGNPLPDGPVEPQTIPGASTPGAPGSVPAAPSVPAIEATKPITAASERAGVVHYVEGDFELNELLRSGRVSQLKDYQRDLVASVDSVMARSTVPAQTVYRGIPANHFGIPNEWLNRLQPGATITDTGFVSTTKVASYAAEFVEELYGQGSAFTLEIKVPAKARALDINKYLAKGEGAEWQNEVLLPRGSRFRVISVDLEKQWAQLELLP